MWYIHWFTYISETLCKCILLTDMFLCSIFKGAFCWYFIHGPPYAAPCDTPQATLRMKGPEDVSAVCWIQQPRSEILSSQFVVSDLNIEQSWFQQISSFFQVKCCNCKIQKFCKSDRFLCINKSGAGHQIAPKIHIGFGLIQAFCNNHHLQWLCSQWGFIKSCHPRLPSLIFFTA